MKYIDEFRDHKLAKRLLEGIKAKAKNYKRFSIMEVCGTHTMAIARYGIRELLPDNIDLVSGPGCPVCVTPNDYLDRAIAIAKDNPGVIIATFGDMLRIPGSHSSLEKERSSGVAVKVVYSPLDALALAKNERQKNVIFLAVGFEATAPGVAATTLLAKREGVSNFSLLVGHKTMPQALKILLNDPKLNIDGFLLPGHVCAIIGSKPFSFISDKFDRSAVVSGFEPLDVLQSIYMLLSGNEPFVDIQYTRLTSRNGNRKAQRLLAEVFSPCDSIWRGIGNIRMSGLVLKDKYGRFDAAKRFNVKVPISPERRGCICGSVLKGQKKPAECRLFSRKCTPLNPVGPCMVSNEGTCAAEYKYGRSSYKATLSRARRR